MKWFLLIVGSIVSLVTVMALVGALLPRRHEATRSASFGSSPAQLYAIVRDFAATPAWRSDVKSIEVLPPDAGRVMFREATRHGAITYRVLEDRPNEKLVTEIADRDLPFGGTWTFEFATRGGGNSAGSLRITERGEVRNVLFRFLGRFVFGHTRTIETYLRDLSRKLGEPTQAPLDSDRS